MAELLRTKNKLTSLNDMFGGVSDVQKSGIIEMEIEKLIPFSRHPFKLYEGTRLQDMVRSVNELGVLTPILVRRLDEDYEILSGHNRWNAAKQIGLSKVPIHILEDINDDEAMLIVTETNLIQRSFGDLLPSERACVLDEHYQAIKCQGRRTDLIEEIKILLKSDEMGNEDNFDPVDQTINSRKIVGSNYDLSSGTVARYIRINKLIKELKECTDRNILSIRAAVEISYLSEEEQAYLAGFLNSGKKLDIEKAMKLHELHKSDKLDEIVMEKVLDGTYNPRKKKSILKGVKVTSNVMKRYFKENQSKKEVQMIIEKALDLYFSRREEV